MIRLLIYTTATDAATKETCFGGLPSVSKEFTWPTCRNCAKHMQFLGQLRIDKGESSKLILLFMCNNKHSGCPSWDPDLGSNKAIVTQAQELSLAPLPEAETDNLVRNCRYGANIVDIDAENYSQARKQNAQGEKMRHILGQLFGTPEWLQSDETPKCGYCGHDMRFVAQLETGPDEKTAMNFGGDGCAYVFDCTCRSDSVKFLWQC